MLPMDLLCFSTVPGKTWKQTVNDPQADLSRRTGHRTVLVLVVFKSLPIVNL